MIGLELSKQKTSPSFIHWSLTLPLSDFTSPTYNPTPLYTPKKQHSKLPYTPLNPITPLTLIPPPHHPHQPDHPNQPHYSHPSHHPHPPNTHSFTHNYHPHPTHPSPPKTHHSRHLFVAPQHHQAEGQREGYPKECQWGIVACPTHITSTLHSPSPKSLVLCGGE